MYYFIIGSIPFLIHSRNFELLLLLLKYCANAFEWCIHVNGVLTWQEVAAMLIDTAKLYTGSNIFHCYCHYYYYRCWHEGLHLFCAAHAITIPLLVSQTIAAFGVTNQMCSKHFYLSLLFFFVLIRNLYSLSCIWHSVWHSKQHSNDQWVHKQSRAEPSRKYSMWEERERLLMGDTSLAISNLYLIEQLHRNEIFIIIWKNARRRIRREREKASTEKSFIYFRWRIISHIYVHTAVHVKCEWPINK